MTIGMRNVKTAISVSLCVIVSSFLKLEYPFYVAIAAIIAMQSSVTASFKAGRDRMLGTTVGALIGLICALILPGNALLCGIGIMLVIYICNLLHWNKSISIAGIVFLAVMINLNGKNPFIYSANRILDTFIGVSITFLVNYLIFPPDTIKKVSKKCYLSISETFDLINKKFILNENVDIEKIDKNVNSLNSKLNLCIEDSKFKNEMLCKINDLKEILNLNKHIYNHLKVIHELEDLCELNSKNIDNLNKLYSVSIPSKHYKETEKNIVFNYHVEKLLIDLHKLKSMSKTPSE